MRTTIKRRQSFDKELGDRILQLLIENTSMSIGQMREEMGINHTYILDCLQHMDRMGYVRSSGSDKGVQWRLSERAIELGKTQIDEGISASYRGLVSYKVPVAVARDPRLAGDRELCDRYGYDVKRSA